MSSKNGKAPIRAFNVGEARAFTQAQRRYVIYINMVANYVVSPNPDIEQLAQLEAQQYEYMRQMFQILIPVINYIPSDWLAENAPADLSFDKPDDFDFLKHGYAQKITDMALGKVEEAEEDAKN